MSPQRSNWWRGGGVVLLAMSLSACAADSGAMTINEYVWGLDELPVDEPQVTEGERSAPTRDGDFSCTTTNLSETRQYDRIVAYAANSESLWPGSIISGDSVYDGLFTPIPFERAPMSFSVSLENLGGVKSKVLAHPKLSSYREALTELLTGEITGATPANIYAELEQVHSEEQLSLALGAQAKWLGGAASISASFDFAREDTRSRYVVRYVQSYYTVDIDPPNSPEEYFDSSVTLEDVQAKVAPGNPPIYVSSITYGRMVIFTFESQYSSQELGAALEFAYRGGVDVSGQVSVSYRDILNSSNITAYILGGSGETAARSIDSFEALMDFIREGGDYSKESPGAPIAYKLSYLANNEPARLSFTEEYTLEDCVRVGQKIKVSLDGIKVKKTGGDGPELEVFGLISASANNETVLFDRDRGGAVQINEAETWPSEGPLAEAILEVEPRPGGVISLSAALMDDEPWYTDDKSIGDETLEIPFETGWRKQVVLHLTGAGAQTEVYFSLLPI